MSSLILLVLHKCVSAREIHFGAGVITTSPNLGTCRAEKELSKIAINNFSMSVRVLIVWRL